jgi:hypothetical protein
MRVTAVATAHTDTAGQRIKETGCSQIDPKDEMGQTERQTERQRETDRQTDRQTERQDSYISAGRLSCGFTPGHGAFRTSEARRIFLTKRVALIFLSEKYCKLLPSSFRKPHGTRNNV